jgi:hypothetical protein
MAVTRCYPMSSAARLITLAQNAVSEVEELGAPSMACFVEIFRPRVARYVAPLHAGLRPPILTVEAYTEHALTAIAAQLHTCTAHSDSALHAWVSAEATRAVLETHADLRRAVRARRSHRVSSTRTRAA